MTAEQLLSPWPAIPHAVAFVELMLEEKDDEALCSSMDLLRANNISPQEATRMIQEMLRDEIDLASKGKWREALAETHHSSFKSYIAGKLGAF